MQIKCYNQCLSKFVSGYRKPNQCGSGSWSHLKAVLWIEIRMDPHSFGSGSVLIMRLRIQEYTRNVFTGVGVWRELG